MYRRGFRTYLHHFASFQTDTSEAWGGGPTTDQPPAPAGGLPVIGAALTTHPLLHESLGTGDGGGPPRPPPDTPLHPPRALPEIIACLHEACPKDVAHYRSMLLAVSTFCKEGVLTVLLRVGPM